MFKKFKLPHLLKKYTFLKLKDSMESASDRRVYGARPSASAVGRRIDSEERAISLTQQLIARPPRR